MHSPSSLPVSPCLFSSFSSDIDYSATKLSFSNGRSEVPLVYDNACSTTSIVYSWPKYTVLSTKGRENGCYECLVLRQDTSLLGEQLDLTSCSGRSFSWMIAPTGFVHGGNSTLEPLSRTITYPHNH